MKRVCPLVLLVLLTACAGAPRDSGRGDGTTDGRARGAPPSACETIPGEAFEVLAEGRADSCSICEEKAQREAFAILDEAFPPGLILRGDPDCPLVRAGGAEPELRPVHFPFEDAGLTFRIHTPADHLVGVAESDFSPAGALPSGEGAVFEGTLEVVAYAYGDGRCFLYSPRRNHVQVQCRIVEGSPR